MPKSYSTPIAQHQILRIKTITTGIYLSCDEISREMDMSRKWIYEYIQHMRKAGALVTEKRKNGLLSYTHTGVYNPSLIEEPIEVDKPLPRIHKEVKPFRDWLTAAFFGPTKTK